MLVHKGQGDIPVFGFRSLVPGELNPSPGKRGDVVFPFVLGGPVLRVAPMGRGLVSPTTTFAVRWQKRK